MYIYIYDQPYVYIIEYIMDTYGYYVYIIEYIMYTYMYS